MLAHWTQVSGRCPLGYLFYVLIKGLRRAWLYEVSESPSRGYWKHFLSYLIPMNTVRIYMQRRGTFYPGVKCPPATPQPSCMLSFLCYNKGIEKSLVIRSSVSPSRGYWKQFLLPRLYEHSQNLPAVEWDTLPRRKLHPPPATPSTLMYVFPSAQATVSHPTAQS